MDTPVLRTRSPRVFLTDTHRSLVKSHLGTKAACKPSFSGDFHVWYGAPSPIFSRTYSGEHCVVVRHTPYNDSCKQRQCTLPPQALTTARHHTTTVGIVPAAMNVVVWGPVLSSRCQAATCYVEHGAPLRRTPSQQGILETSSVAAMHFVKASLNNRPPRKWYLPSHPYGLLFLTWLHKWGKGSDSAHDTLGLPVGHYIPDGIA